MRYFLDKVNAAYGCSLIFLTIKKYQELTGQDFKITFKFQKTRKGDVLRHRANISHAQKILGYKPRIDLEEGITRYLKWKLGMKN